jgi:hypothetical protein
MRGASTLDGEQPDEDRDRDQDDVRLEHRRCASRPSTALNTEMAGVIMPSP